VNDPRAHPAVGDDVETAASYYESCEPGLGIEFAEELASTIDMIVSFPTAWTIIEDGVRRALVRRFPYGIFYTIESDDIYILAIGDLHRSPDFWKSRRA
jgi:plasmid stabilization system protein ParE